MEILKFRGLFTGRKHYFNGLTWLMGFMGFYLGEQTIEKLFCSCDLRVSFSGLLIFRILYLFVCLFSYFPVRKDQKIVVTSYSFHLEIDILQA